MSAAARIALAVLVALALPATTLAAAGQGIRVVPLKAKFPERKFVVGLPRAVSTKATGIRVLENGAPVAELSINSTSAARAANSGTVLVIDASNSMRGEPVASAVEAARMFAAQRRASQPLALITFNATPTVRLPFTRDADAIAAALAEEPVLARGTNLYDALRSALDLIDTSGASGAASVVVLSDGADTGSDASVAAVTRLAESRGTRVFTVGLKSGQFHADPLRELAAKTGGSYSEATSPEELARIYDQLGHRLANEYLIEYKSFAPLDAKVHVSVKVAGVSELGVATYRAPKLAANAPTVFNPSAVDRVIQSPLTLLVLVTMIAALIGLSLTMLVRPKASGFRNRLGAFVGVAPPAETKQRQTSALSDRLLAGTERSLQRTRWWAGFKEELEIAEIRWPAEQVVVLTVLGTVFGMWILMFLFGGLFAVLGLGVPLAVRSFVNYRARRQRRAFDDQLPDNLQVLASALRAGHSLIGALSVVVDDAPEPSRREFRRVVADEQLGVSLEDGLTVVATRMRNRDLDQVALVAALQRETGGNSAEVLDRVAETVRDRAALRRLVRTLTAQGRMARWIVSGLPVALLLVISVLNPNYMSPMTSRTVGWVLLGFAGVLVIMGSLVIKRIINIRL